MSKFHNFFERMDKGFANVLGCLSGAIVFVVIGLVLVMLGAIIAALLHRMGWIGALSIFALLTIAFAFAYISRWAGED